jgi:hypothetical protein
MVVVVNAQSFRGLIAKLLVGAMRFCGFRGLHYSRSDTITVMLHLEGESSRIRSTNGMLDDQELQVGYMYDVFNKRTNQ